MAAVQPNYPSPPQDMARHSSTPPPLANSMEQQNYAPIPQANPVARQSSTPPPQANPMPQQSYLIEQQNYAPLPQVNQMPQQIYVPLPQAKPMPQQNYSPLPQVSPMAQQSYAPLPQANPMAIVGPQFCASNTIDLAIVRKVWTVSHGNFEVTDVNGNPMFKVRGRALTRHAKRVLLNSAGYPIITLRQKILSAHSRWQVFRGDSSDTKDLIFSVKTSSRFQFKTHLDVFLAYNITEEVCDFKVKGNWSQRSCVIYAGESSNIVAQMYKKYTVRSVLLGKYEFMVTVYPHVDHAFIVALIVILDEINSDD